MVFWNGGSQLTSSSCITKVELDFQQHYSYMQTSVREISSYRPSMLNHGIVKLKYKMILIKSQGMKGFIV